MPRAELRLFSPDLFWKASEALFHIRGLDNTYEIQLRVTLSLGTGWVLHQSERRGRDMQPMTCLPCCLSKLAHPNVLFFRSSSTSSIEWLVGGRWANLLKFNEVSTFSKTGPVCQMSYFHIATVFVFFVHQLSRADSKGIGKTGVRFGIKLQCLTPELLVQASQEVLIPGLCHHVYVCNCFLWMLSPPLITQKQ